MLLFLAGLVWLGLGAADGERPLRVLEIESQGYSRFEIEGDSVVAYFPDPVVFRYLGYTISTSRLRYDQQNELAVADGGVCAVSEDHSMEAASISFDGRAGLIAALGGVSASDRKLGLALHGEEAQLNFPPEAKQVELAEATIVLKGSVTLADAAGSRLQCDEAEYSGGEARIGIPGSFHGRYVLQEALVVNKGAPAIAAVSFSGHSLMSTVTVDSLLEEVNFAGALIEAGEACLAGDFLTATRSTGSDSAPELWRFSLTGSPACGQAVANGEAHYFRAPLIRGVLPGEERLQLELQGETLIWSEGQALTCSRALISKGEEGLAVSLPGGFEARGDIAAFTGAEPLDLGNLRDVAK